MTSSLLPPSTTQLERYLEQTTDRALDAALDALWDAQRCPLALLPWLAWALGVRQWSDTWSEQRKRDEVAAALNIRRHAGTLGAMRSVIKAHAIEGAAISEWFDYGGQPGHFRLNLDLDGVGISARAYRDLIAGLQRAKRLSAHFDPTQIRIATRGHIRLGAGRHTSGSITLQPHRPRFLETHGRTSLGTGQHSSGAITLAPYHPSFLHATGLSHLGIGQHGSVHTTLYPG